MNGAPTTQAAPREGVIELALGHPSPALLPLELLREAAGRALGAEDPSLLQYGLEAGGLRFRRALASFLSRQYASPVLPEELFVSNGVSQALDLICTLFTNPGDCVFVEEPTYFLALRIFADHGLRTIGIPTDREGLIPQALAKALTGERRAFLYTVPTYQNPSGATLPESRRTELLELAREHGLLVVADEVYHPLSYGSRPPRAFACSASQPGVLSLGSFSKILAPGLRLGWIQGAPELLRRLAGCGLLDSGGGLNPFASGIVSAALEGGLVEKHLEGLRREYGSRARALAAALRATLPDGLEVGDPGGGFFIWLPLPDGCDSQALLDRAVRAGVSFVPGTRFSTRGDFRDRLRLSFSYYDSDRLTEAARRLGSVL